MEAEMKKQLQAVANTIRSLSMDAIQAANSGHPGLPMGCAEIGAVLYGQILGYYPDDPAWYNRDRFVLSAGHGSMFLYSLLHLSGYAVSLNDIKKFRQADSITPGHPEVFETPGVEMTTGPLGQGLATAVGMALGAKILAEKFNTSQHKIFDYNVYALAGDGCLMEGISYEASSFAAHYGLDNFVIIYDANQISLDGPLSDSFSENVAKRYEAFGFSVSEVDGHDIAALDEALRKLKAERNARPKLLICRTVIGKGAPTVQGTSACHGSPLGAQELKAAKRNLGLPEEESFTVLTGVREFFLARREHLKKTYDDWQKLFLDWQKSHPELFTLFQQMQSNNLPVELESKMPTFSPSETIAGRKASQTCLNVIAGALPSFIGGSADLSCSDCTEIKGGGFLGRKNFTARNIKYGVREFAMAAITNGLSLTGFFKPFCGTFLCFSDYMRPAIRLAALCGLDVAYQFTHDSVWLGEDGPTHQPVEHAAALRVIPNLLVFRPADGNETRAAWLTGLQYKGPKAFLLSRQNLPNLTLTNRKAADSVGRGAYILSEEKPDQALDLILFSSGSELSLSLEVTEELRTKGFNVRLVSVPCHRLFEHQDEEYQKNLLALHARKRASIEAQVSFGWHRFTGLEGRQFSIERFGKSAPLKELQSFFAFTKAQLVAELLELLEVVA